MKTIEYLSNLKKGEVITNKRVLSLFKRLGYIYDYSEYGYLESTWVYRIDPYETDGKLDSTISYSPIDKIGTRENPYGKEDKDFYKGQYPSFEYKGFKFGTRYLDGCFSAYLCRE